MLLEGEYIQIGNDINETAEITSVSINDDGSVIAYSILEQRTAHVFQYNSATILDPLGSQLDRNL